MDILECEEFGEITLEVSSLLVDGRFRIDERIGARGYLAASIKGGALSFRATKFVGSFPLNERIVIRVKPWASVPSLTHMIVRSGLPPATVVGFARGYLPKFVLSNGMQKIFGRSLVEDVRQLVRRGLKKEYVRPLTPPPWRGRLLPSSTVRKYASKGIRYRHEFDFSELSFGSIENVALKVALEAVEQWLLIHERKSPLLAEVRAALVLLSTVPAWKDSRAELARRLRERLSDGRVFERYEEALWHALAILQDALPEVGEVGVAQLDSLIVEISRVFEGFVRRELLDRIALHGLLIEDGNHKPFKLFVDTDRYTVHPDIIVRRGEKVVALIDVKYKKAPKEQDRYELLSFMESCGAQIGIFVSPKVAEDGVVGAIGTTQSDKKLFSLRFDMAVDDLDGEADKLTKALVSIVNAHT